MKNWCECRIDLISRGVPSLEKYLRQYSFCSYAVSARPRARMSEVLIYIPERKSKAFLKELSGAVELLALAFPGKKKPELFVRTRQEKDWHEEWKTHFQALNIGPFIIQPSWEKKKRVKGKTIIEIDPGMAFGTGHHFTTEYCIKNLARYGRKSRNFLDAGCGSGILSIIAGHCGAEHITGIDMSQEAVLISRENFQKNCPKKKAVFQRMKLEKLSPSKKFDCITANIYDRIILKNALLLKDLLLPKGILMLTGIRFSKTEAVLKAFSELHLLDKESDEKKEWTGLTFQKK